MQISKMNIDVFCLRMTVSAVERKQPTRSLIILLTTVCSEYLNKSPQLTLRTTELGVCAAYRALKCKTLCSLLFVEVMDGAHQYSGSPVRPLFYSDEQ